MLSSFPNLREFLMKNGKGGTGLVRENRLQIMLSPGELKAVDNFRFRHRIPVARQPFVNFFDRGLLPWGRSSKTPASNLATMGC